MIAAGTAVRSNRICDCGQTLWRFPIVDIDENGVTQYATAVACPDCDSVD